MIPGTVDTVAGITNKLLIEESAKKKQKLQYKATKQRKQNKGKQPSPPKLKHSKKGLGKDKIFMDVTRVCTTRSPPRGADLFAQRCTVNQSKA